MRFVYLDSRFTLHASSPRSVALTQLRFACLAVASLAGDLHPEECAHAGRTKKTDAEASVFLSCRCSFERAAQPLFDYLRSTTSTRREAALLAAVPVVSAGFSSTVRSCATPADTNAACTA